MQKTFQVSLKNPKQWITAKFFSPTEVNFAQITQVDNTDATIFSYISENAGTMQPLEKKDKKMQKYQPSLFDICHKMLSDFKYK